MVIVMVSKIAGHIFHISQFWTGRKKKAKSKLAYGKNVSVMLLKV